MIVKNSRKMLKIAMFLVGGFCISGSALYSMEEEQLIPEKYINNICEQIIANNTDSNSDEIVYSTCEKYNLMAGRDTDKELFLFHNQFTKAKLQYIINNISNSSTKKALTNLQTYLNQISDGVADRRDAIIYIMGYKKTIQKAHDEIHAAALQPELYEKLTQNEQRIIFSILQNCINCCNIVFDKIIV